MKVGSRKDRQACERITGKLQDEIDKVYGPGLDWRRKDGQIHSSICATLNTGGYRDDLAGWPETQKAMIDALLQLESAIKPHLGVLGV